MEKKEAIKRLMSIYLYKDTRYNVKGCVIVGTKPERDKVGSINGYPAKVYIDYPISKNSTRKIVIDIGIIKFKHTAFESVLIPLNWNGLPNENVKEAIDTRIDTLINKGVRPGEIRQLICLNI